MGLSLASEAYVLGEFLRKLVLSCSKEWMWLAPFPASFCLDGKCDDWFCSSCLPQ